MIKYLNKIYQILLDFLLVIITVLILFSLYNIITVKLLDMKYTNFLGFTTFEVISGSMEPSINIKDFIIVRKTNDVKIGDIVTYKEEGEFITHRIIDIKGEVLTTKGDANNSNDHKVTKNNLVGKVVFKIPKLGIIREILTTPKVALSLVLFLIMLSICSTYLPKPRIFIKETLDKEFADISNLIIRR